MDNLTMEQIYEEKHAVTNVDFRMVTFTLAGRDYAIDIMKVKEISKDNRFTYVPNAAPFVMGVYNLRGDIISVIDLRIFFNQMTRNDMNDESNLENMIILRLEDHTIAVIVDSIDKVVGIPSNTIQPPHPLFGDINVKYISGIVESDKKLYVILDVERIFNSEETEITENQLSISSAVVIDNEEQFSADVDKNNDELNISFISESLATYKKLYVTSVNLDWIKQRYKKWSQERRSANQNIQFENESDADHFLSPFFSPYTGNFWGPDYAEALKKMIPDNPGGTFYVLNGGCGNGAESYSIASIIKKNNPAVQLKILAYDNDLMNISSAPSLSIDKNQIPDYYWNYLTETVSGSWQFNEAIKDSIIFEYHDMGHNANLPALDMVVARDLISLLSPETQLHVLAMIIDNLKPGGVLIVGQNEKIDISMGFEEKTVDGVVYYLKK